MCSRQAPTGSKCTISQSKYVPIFAFYINIWHKTKIIFDAADLSLCTIWGCQCCFCRLVGAPVCQNCCKKIQNGTRLLLYVSTNFRSQLKRNERWSHLFNSNLDALCLSRFRIHMARDRPDARAVPPAVTPMATVVAEEERAAEHMRHD